MTDIVEKLRRAESVFVELKEAADEIERLRTELDVHKRYTNRDIQAQIEQAFETKRRTGKFPFED